MRKRSLVVILVIVVVAIVAAVAMRSHGGGLLAGWLPALHGVRGH